MANCMFCGKPVIVGKVVHTACMEAHAKEELKETICDHCMSGSYRRCDGCDYAK